MTALKHGFPIMKPAQSLADLEPSVCEAALMAGVASSLAEDLLGSTDFRRATDEQIEQALFCVYETQRKVEALKARFYAAISG